LIKSFTYRKLSDYEFLSIDVNLRYDLEELSTVKLLAKIFLVFWTSPLPIIFAYIHKIGKNQTIMLKILNIFGFLM
jgi:hypothetical protein